MEQPERKDWRVLYIDDDEDDYLLAREMLHKAQGRHIVLEWAPTYETGLARLLAGPYDAALVDYDLGAQTGIDLIRAVSAACRVPIILYTGRGSYEVDLEAMNAGATLYITKSEANPLLLERFIRYAIQLKQLEQERADLIDSIQDGFLAINRDWEITYINRRAARNGGREPEELVGRNVWEAFPRLAGTPVEQVYRQVMQDRQMKKFEMPGVYQELWYEISVYPFYDGISIYWQDISEKKRSKVDPGVGEQRYHKLFESMQEAFFVCEIIRDENGQPVDLRYLESNPAALAMGGFQQPSDVVGRTHRELYSPNETSEMWRTRFSQVAITGEPQHFIQFAQTTGRYYSAYAYSPEPGLCAAFLTDITEQKLAELAVVNAHRRTTEILESISDAFYSLDHENRFTYINQKAASLWGLRAEDLIGRNIWEVFPNGKMTESYQKIQQALTYRQPIQYESYSAFLDQWIDIHLYPTDNGISVYFQEITERKRAEAALKEYMKELERSNRDLQEFAFVASHDLQEPLRKIEALGEMVLRETPELADPKRDMLMRMRKAAGRMREMVDGLLLLSRLSTLAQDYQTVDLGKIVHEVLADLDLQIHRSGAVVEAGELPVIQADPLQMRQLFQNLIGNALKFQPPGGRPEVSLTATRPGPETVQIEVKDNGIGFDEAGAAQLFQPFKRLVGRSEFEGTGMGLAISRKIVERHGGTIAARGQSGQGVTFIITLPARQTGFRGREGDNG